MSYRHAKLALVAAFAGLMLTGETSLAQQPAPGVRPVQPLEVGSIQSGQSGQAEPRASDSAKPLIPLRLLVTISRYEGERRISSQPFTLWVNANDGQTTSLSTGQQVPIPQTVFNTGTGAMVPAKSFTYQSIGTSISAKAARMDDGRFRIDLDVSDSSVVPAAKDSDGMVILKSLKAHNLLLLRDGQDADFLASTDKINGEVTKIEVTATVLK